LQRQKAILENIPACVFLKNTAGRYTAVNRMYYEMFGDISSDAVGKTDAELFSPSQAVKFSREDRRVLENGEAVCIERATRSRSGEIADLALSMAPVRDAEGHIEGMVGVAFDVTARKRAEELARDACLRAERVSGELAIRAEQLEDARRATLNVVDDLERRERALREANEFQKKLLATAAGAMFTVDNRRRITMVNQAFCDITGFSEQEVLGKCCSMLEGEPCRDHCGLFDPERTEAISRRQCVVTRKDGTPITILKSADLVRDDAGEIIGGIESFVDVTELVNAKRLAEEASRAKSDFLAKMSHEIRTPMNGIIGMTEMALETPLSPEQREYMTLVRNSGESLLNIINDILDFSKIEAGKFSLDCIDFSLADTVGQALADVRIKAWEKDLELLCDVKDSMPDRLIGDPGRLRQIIINLIGNAVKFTETGEVTARVACDGEPHDGEMTLHFSVQDTGIGIPPEKLSAIFDAFEQADGSTTRRFGGTGLGLSISAQLVMLMGGNIWVESEMGKGSKFHFTVQVGVREQRSRDDRNPTGRLAGLKALVVDDNAPGREILVDILHRWGIEAVTAADGVSAVESAVRSLRDGRPFELVLLDSHMPGMDGFETARRLRQHLGQEVPLVMLLTSAGAGGETLRCRSMDVAHHLYKPVLPTDLLGAILHALGDQDALEAADETPEGQQRLRRRLRILLAEDNPVNQKVACHLLEKWGHTVQVADNGAAALELHENEPFDLVLMDVQMPGVSGLEATASIRRKEDSSGAHVPIIAMTAHAMKGDRERCLEAGMDDYVSKPINPSLLAGAMARLFGPEEAAEVDDSHGPKPIPISERVFSIERAANRADGCKELLIEIVSIFVDTCPNLVGEIRSALARGDAPALNRSAHSLKGAAGSIVADEVFEAALALEQTAKKGDLIGAIKLTERLEDKVDRLMDALKQFLKESAVASPDSRR
ncbi:MAG: response regulator, partial [Phycisphaerae bacterium]